MLRSLFRRFFARPVPHYPPHHLTEAEALKIARGAIGGTVPLAVSGIVRTRESVEWRIGTATVGSGETVRIDDATGMVIERSTWGVR